MEKTVYVSMSTDIIHGGHIAIIEKASQLGKVTVGVLTDEAVASFKRYPLLNYDERVKIISQIKGVNRVIEQDSISYRKVLTQLKPDMVVHGDNWKTDHLKPIREETLEILRGYGGELVEFPYSYKSDYRKLDAYFRERASLPDVRRARLKKRD